MPLLIALLIFIVFPLHSQITTRAAGAESFALCNLYFNENSAFRVANTAGYTDYSEINSIIAISILQPFIQSDVKQLDVAYVIPKQHYTYGANVQVFKAVNLSKITLGNSLSIQLNPKTDIAIQLSCIHQTITSGDSSWLLQTKTSINYQISNKLRLGFFISIPSKRNALHYQFCHGLHYQISKSIQALCELEFSALMSPITKVGFKTQLNEHYYLLNGFDVTSRTLGIGLIRRNKPYITIFGINYHPYLGSGISLDFQYAW